MRKLQETALFVNQKVLVRCDLDVPLVNGSPENTYRLDSNIPTLEYIIEKKAHPIIVGKIGSPKGKHVPELSTKHLKSYFDQKIGSQNYTLLENSRFDPREKENEKTFAEELALQAEIYVNECFATSHRNDATIVGVPGLIPSFAGFHLQQEVETLSKILQNPERPLVALIGGAKLESKLPTVNKFIKVADKVLLGGLLGLNWKDSKPDNLFLPKDYEGKNMDIGPKTVELYKNYLNEAKTILWAGPMGAFEQEQFAFGTYELGKIIAESGAFSIIGGGDTIQATRNVGITHQFSFVSTGGGAMLEFLSSQTLPGLEALGYTPTISSPN